MFRFYLFLNLALLMFKHGISIEFSKHEESKINVLRKLHFQPGRDVNDFPFRNKSLPIKDRVNDLVSRLSLDEVILQLARGGAGPNGPAPGIDKLGVNPYNWNNEGIHGYVSPQYSTGFPSPIGLAATFNKSAIFRMAQIVAVEARASYNMFLKEKNFGDHTCLSLFAPVINIMRHPLWGRNQETYGEDPVLTSYMARSYVAGLQSLRAGYPGATSVCKHFGVHDGPENIPLPRFSFNAEVSEFDFGQTFMFAFRQCVLAHTHGIMCSYNAINGVPACANKFMITDVLRGQFKFDGYVVSDEGAIEHIDLNFNYTKSPLDTAVASKNAGVDLELTYYGVNNRFSLLNEAVQKGFVEEESLRESARRLFNVRMILGEFDPPEDNPWNSVGTDEILSAPHRELAADIAEQSYVMLKNDGAIPLKGKIDGKVAFLGPFANNTLAVTGDYNTNPNHTYTTPVDSWPQISTQPPNVAAGCVGPWNKDLPLCQKYDQSEVKGAITSDVKLIVVTIGTGTNMEAEGHDRANMLLPASQYQLLNDALNYAAGSIPIIIVIYSAGPLIIDDYTRNPYINTIIVAHFPAQSAGTLGPIMMGERSPAGRLPYTWYKSDYQLPSITNYNLSDAGLTYRYTSSGNVLYPFGYGLSFGKFSFTNLNIKTPSKCHDIIVEFDVTNAGIFDADEVVQVYFKLSKSNGDNVIPMQLAAFDRVHLMKGETKSMQMLIEPFSRAVWMQQGGGFDYYIVPGQYTVWAGGEQPGQTATTGSVPIHSTFSLSLQYPLSDCDMK